MNLQPNYGLGVAVGVVGMIANEEKNNVVSRTVTTALGLAFGQPAFRGANDHEVVSGAAFSGSSVSSVDATNIGTATISAAPAVALPAMAGRYIIELLGTGATAAFHLLDPAGVIVGDGNVGSAATLGGLGPFTITTGGTPTVGDRFYIDVTYLTDAKYLGMAVLNPAQPAVATNPDFYPQYATASVMTMGVMWALAGAAVVAGGLVYWDPATGRYSSDVTKIRIPNSRFDTSGGNGDLVKIATRLRDA